jgi:hypothetical protein
MDTARRIFKGFLTFLLFAPIIFTAVPLLSFRIAMEAYNNDQWPTDVLGF